MVAQRNWRMGVDADDQLRFNEKRLMHEERRPFVREASSLLGPGFGQYAIRTFDWNQPDCLSNGFWYSVANQVLNSPDNALYWMGITEGHADGNGVQRVRQYQFTTFDVEPIREYNRRFWTDSLGVLQFGTWQTATGGGSGGGGTAIGGVVWGPWQGVARNAVLWNAGTIRYRRSLDGSFVDLNIRDLSCSVDLATSAYGNITDRQICGLPVDAYPDVSWLVTLNLVASGIAVVTAGISSTGVVTAYTTTLDGNDLLASYNLHGSLVYGAKTTATGTGGGGTITVQENDVNVVTGATTLDFQGPGVDVTTGATGEAIVTITGGLDSYTHVQGTPASTWVIDHPLTFLPNVTVVDSTGRQAEGDVVYTDADTLTITFSAAFSGKAYLS